jgi:hypothetical protein
MTTLLMPQEKETVIFKINYRHNTVLSSALTYHRYTFLEFLHCKTMYENIIYSSQYLKISRKVNLNCET